MSTSKLPQLPDYFGFIIGFLLIWLVYTGFSAVRGVFVNTQNKVVHYSEQAKKITKESVQEIKKHIVVDKAVDEIEKKLARARIKESKEDKVVVAENKNQGTQSWTTKQLKNANSFINGLILGIEDFVSEPEEHHEVTTSSEPKVEAGSVRKRSDSLEWFE